MRRSKSSFYCCDILTLILAGDLLVQMVNLSQLVAGLLLVTLDLLAQAQNLLLQVSLTLLDRFDGFPSDFKHVFRDVQRVFRDVGDV